MRLVVKGTVASGETGDVELVPWIFCDGTSFKTSPSSTPASTHVENRVQSAGNIDCSLFDGGRLFGSISSSAGEIVIKNGDGALDSWMEYGISGRAIECWYGEGDSFPTGYTQVYVMYGYQLIADFATIRIKIRDQSYLLDKPMSFGRFAGTGGIEGGEDLAGKPKQRIVGRMLAPVILVDYATQLYQVSESYTNPVSGTPAESYALYEGGVLIENDGAPYTGTASEFIALSIAEGKCKWWYGEHDDSGDRGTVYVRTQGEPIGELRASFYGSKYVFDLPQYNWQFHHFAQQAGIGVGLGEGMASDPPLYVGSRLLLDGAETYRDFLTDACQVLCCFYGIDRFDDWFAGRFETPDETALATFTVHNSKNWELQPPLGKPAPISKVVGEFGETFPCQLQEAPDEYIAKLLTRQGAFDSVEGDNSDVLTKHAFAPVDQITARNGGERIYENPTTGDLDFFRGEAFTTPYISLFGRETKYLTLQVPFTAENLALNLLDTVRVQRNRMGFDLGENFRIVRISIDAQTRTMTLDLWNGVAELWAGDEGGGGDTVDEFWVYGDYPTPPPGPPSYLTPEYSEGTERPYDDYTGATDPENYGDETYLWLIRKDVDRTGGTVNDATTSEDETPPSIDWTPTTPEDPAPEIVFVADGFWRFPNDIYGNYDGVAVVHAGEDLEIIVTFSLQDGYQKASWEYNYTG